LHSLKQPKNILGENFSHKIYMQLKVFKEGISNKNKKWVGAIVSTYPISLFYKLLLLLPATPPVQVVHQTHLSLQQAALSLVL
jgi:hypothetical protein